jgi:hypothetical protein
VTAIETEDDYLKALSKAKKLEDLADEGSLAVVSEGGLNLPDVMVHLGKCALAARDVTRERNKADKKMARAFVERVGELGGNGSFVAVMGEHHVPAFRKAVLKALPGMRVEEMQAPHSREVVKAENGIIDHHAGMLILWRKADKKLASEPRPKPAGSPRPKRRLKKAFSYS